MGISSVSAVELRKLGELMQFSASQQRQLKSEKEKEPED